MAGIRAGAILVFLSVFPGSERVSGQRAPCYECEDYKENHPRTSPYQQIRTQCSYPCECEEREPTCPPDVPVVRDGCGCCPICAGQLGQPCDGTSICDDRKGLICRYPYLGAAVGICHAATGLPCMVFNKTYGHGETFQTDCRTQCSCQNGTYACSSLCPNENISPKGACTHPRLVEVPEQCCREWMCDSTEAEHPPVCKQEFTSWSACSAECGLGISRRVSNINQNCVLRNETRMCQLRPCESGMLSLAQHARHRHIRKGHECKATQRVRGPVRLRFGPCRSKKRYRPKFCGSCDEKVGDSCCVPQLSTTIKVEFICNSLGTRKDPDNLLLELIELGRDLWWPDDLLAIGKQRSAPETSQILPSVRPPFETRRKAPKNAPSVGKKIPHRDPKFLDKYLPRKLAVSQEDARLLLFKGRPNEPLRDGEIFSYESGSNEEKRDEIDRSNLEATTNSLVGRTDTKLTFSSSTTEETSTQAAATDPTTSRPKKKKKKKPRKAFTSWLEFRDEEYQMDEYEDEEEPRTNRKKRSPSGPQLKKTEFKQDKRFSGSFREGFLEETEDGDTEYDDDDDDDDDDDGDDGDNDDNDGDGEEDEDENGDSEDSDEEDDDEEEDSDEDKEDDEEDQVGRRSRLQKKPRFTFHRRKRETPARETRKRGIHLVRKRKKEKISSGTRMSRISEDRGATKKNSEPRKRKEKEGYKDKPRYVKENGFTEWRYRKINESDAFQEGRTGTGKDKTVNVHKNKKGLYHIAGKVHKNRSRRHAPRPPWKEAEETEEEEEVEEEEEDEEEEEEEEAEEEVEGEEEEVEGEEEGEEENLIWGDHTVSFSVQWIVKCRCDRDCFSETTTVSSPINTVGEIVLKRVHRTAPP